MDKWSALIAAKKSAYSAGQFAVFIPASNFISGFIYKQVFMMKIDPIIDSILGFDFNQIYLAGIIAVAIGSGFRFAKNWAKYHYEKYFNVIY